MRRRTAQALRRRAVRRRRRRAVRRRPARWRRRGGRRLRAVRWRVAARQLQRHEAVRRLGRLARRLPPFGLGWLRVLVFAEGLGREVEEHGVRRRLVAGERARCRRVVCPAARAVGRARLLVLRDVERRVRVEVDGEVALARRRPVLERERSFGEG